MFKLKVSSDINIGDVFMIVSSSRSGKYISYLTHVHPCNLDDIVDLFNRLDGLVSDEFYCIPGNKLFDILEVDE